MAQVYFYFNQLFTIIAIMNIGLCSALHVEISPEPFNALLHQELNLTCVADGHAHLAPKTTVLTLQLERENHEPIAVFSRKKLSDGPNMEPNMQAEGHIAEDASHSYIKLTIKNPRAQDAGPYVCVLFYIDESFELNEERTNFNVTVENTDVKAVVTHLMGRVTDLENTVQNQAGTIHQQGNQLEKQDQNMQEVVAHFIEQMDTMKTLLLDQRNQLLEQKKQITHLDNRTTQYMQKDSLTSAFFVGNTYKGSLSKHQVLVFNDVIENTGGDYSPDTGLYTAPVDGLYAFHLYGMAHGSGSKEVQVEVYANSIVVAILLVEDGDSYDQSSVSAVVRLREGDTVKCAVVYASSTGVRLYSFPYTGFSGHLIKSLDV